MTTTPRGRSPPYGRRPVMINGTVANTDLMRITDPTTYEGDDMATTTEAAFPTAAEMQAIRDYTLVTRRTPRTAAVDELPTGLLRAAGWAAARASEMLDATAADDDGFARDLRRILDGTAWLTDLLETDHLSSYHGMARDLGPDASLGDYLRYLAAVADYADGTSSENPG